MLPQMGRDAQPSERVFTAGMWAYPVFPEEPIMKYLPLSRTRNVLWVLGLTPAFLPGPAQAAGDQTDATAAWIQKFSARVPQWQSEGLCLPAGKAMPSFTVTPDAVGRRTVRVSLPFPPGSLPAEVGLNVRAGDRSIDADLQLLTFHPGRPRSVRRAIVTFAYDFTDNQPVTFMPVWSRSGNIDSAPTSQSVPGAINIAGAQLRFPAGAVELWTQGTRLWRCEFVAPERQGRNETVVEVIARGKHYLWLRLLLPDEGWPRIIEVRADGLGTVALRGHLQRLEPTADAVARAPDIGWRIAGQASASIRVTGGSSTAPELREHAFAEGGAASVQMGSQRVDLPDAHLLRRGSVMVHNQGGRGEVVYWRCRESEQVPMQRASWRTATVVLGPEANPPWTALLEPPLEVAVDAEAFDAIYDSGRPQDLRPWDQLESVNRFHIDAIASSPLAGDDFGNVTSMPTSGVYGMNRLNHCPPIFEAYFRTGDERLRATGLHWCGNYHDLSIWWGIDDQAGFGGTRYNNLSAMDGRPADPNFMWRSNRAVNFCTKGYDSFLYAYEETGDPRMAVALHWQMDYAAREVHADRGECRNIGDVADWMRLYRFTGDQTCLEAGLRLFRELRTKLSEGDLFSQGGQPIVKDPPFIDDDKTGTQHPFPKPYIIGYALAGLPALARQVPDEPKLRDVIRAVADFMADAQDPTGGWRYPHARSSSVFLAQAMEHAAQLARAASWLESRGEPVENLLHAIERTLQARILGWQQRRQFLSGLGGWERAAGILKDGQTLHDLYGKPGERDRSRDYTEGQVSLGGAAPEGVVYFFEVLNFYLAHRPAERLFHANEPLSKVLSRISAAKAEAVTTGPTGEYLAYGVVDQMPTFREALLDRLTFSMAWNPAGALSFTQWRQQARDKVFECLLTPPPRTDFKPVMIAHEDRGTYDAHKLVFNVSADCRVPAYLLVPKGEGPFPAVIALHDHGAFFLIGKEKMVRPIGERAEITEAAQKWVDQAYGGRFIGDMLAERGYVVFSADALFWGERGRREGVDYNQQQALASNLMQMGTTWLGINTWDDIRAAEFVASLPQVDPVRMGAVGLSMGCHRTWMLHALSDRIAAAIGVCWMGTTGALMAPGNNQTKGHSSYSMLAPNLRNYLDYPDVVSIACPKPLLLFDGGEQDKLFPVDGVDAAYDRLRQVWEGRGAGERLVTRRWDVGHVFNREMQDEAFAWLDRWLKKTTRINPRP
jgi:dienelactone hydrolase